MAAKAISKDQTRRGSAAVEFALVAPFVVLLLLGSIEIGRAVMVQHMLQEAAQAGCRVYSVAETTQGQADEIIAEAMRNAGIDQYEVEYSPASKAEIDESMEHVTVTIDATYEDVGWLAPFHMNGAVLVGRSTMPADVIDGDGDDDTGGNTKKATKKGGKKGGKKATKKGGKKGGKKATKKGGKKGGKKATKKGGKKGGKKATKKGGKKGGKK